MLPNKFQTNWLLALAGFAVYAYELEVKWIVLLYELLGQYTFSTRINKLMQYFKTLNNPLILVDMYIRYHEAISTLRSKLTELGPWFRSCDIRLVKIPYLFVHVKYWVWMMLICVWSHTLTTTLHFVGCKFAVDIEVKGLEWNYTSSENWWQMTKVNFIKIKILNNWCGSWSFDWHTLQEKYFKHQILPHLVWYDTWFFFVE